MLNFTGASKAVLIALVVLALAIVPVGCSKTVAAQHPGSINAFDSQTYDIISGLRVALANIKTSFGTNPSPTTKDIINRAIVAYDALSAAYNVYHAAGVPNATAEADLQTKIKAAQTAFANLNVPGSKPAK